MNKIKNILFILFIGSIGVQTFSSCGKGGGGSGGNSGEEASVRLFLGKLAIPMFDSISVLVSAPDMVSVRISEKSVSDNLRINAIPHGQNRKFEVTIYADSGKPVQKGEAVADINADETITIPITLNALAGFLKLEVPLGIPNNTEINSGKLFLEGKEIEMAFEIGKGVFNTGSLPLDKSLTLTVKLYDNKNQLLFTGSKTVTLTSILQNETVQLQSTKGIAILELQASIQGPVQILATFPASVYGSRTPENYGDLIFTEILTDPTEGNDNFQYMELYNATLDTLQLSNCRIARQIDTPSGSGRLNLSGSLILPPTDYFVLGRNSVVNADYNYGTFALLKTSQSLGFFCGDLIIDTLTYSKENLFPLEKGRAMQLPISNYATRTLGQSWCLGFSLKSDAICQ